MVKELISGLAVAVTFIAFFPYIHSILSGRTKPHVFLTTIDVIGFGPTIRKAFAHPYDEDLRFFALFAFRNLLVIMALERYSMATMLFPAVIASVCLLFIGMIVHRRRIVG